MTIDLDKLQALADACFIGPWRAETWTVECDHEDRCDDDHEVETVLSPDYPGEQVVAQVDDEIHTPGMERFARPHAEFIAACRDAVPELIAKVRKQEEALRACLGLIAANRLLLGHYMGPREVNRVEKLASEALRKGHE